MKTLIRSHVLWRLIWVCLVCPSPTERAFKCGLINKLLKKANKWSLIILFLQEQSRLVLVCIPFLSNSVVFGSQDENCILIDSTLILFIRTPPPWRNFLDTAMISEVRTFNLAFCKDINEQRRLRRWCTSVCSTEWVLNIFKNYTCIVSPVVTR